LSQIRFRNRGGLGSAGRGGHRRDAASWSAKGRLGIVPAHAVHVTAIESGNRVDEWGIAAPGRVAEPPRHRQAKGAGTHMLGLTPPRHTSTLPTVVVCFAQGAGIHDGADRAGSRMRIDVVRVEINVLDGVTIPCQVTNSAARRQCRSRSAYPRPLTWCCALYAIDSIRTSSRRTRALESTDSTDILAPPGIAEETTRQSSG
jgi:hypothetical protein